MKLEQNGTTFEEELDCAAGPVGVNQSQEFILTHRSISRSVAGMQVKVSIAEKREVVNDTNNAASIAVHHLDLALAGQLAIRFDNGDLTKKPATAALLPDFEPFRSIEQDAVLGI